MTNTPKYVYRSMPIEQDPRFKKMMKEYKERCDFARNLNCLAVSAVLSTITSPLRVISMSMQMSVMPNITIYGDVNPKDINKGLLTERLGMGNMMNRKAIATSEKEVAKYEGGAKSLVPKPEPRADLIKASGQVGHNKPFRAPIYRTYYECIQGLYK